MASVLLSTVHMYHPLEPVAIFAVNLAVNNVGDITIPLVHLKGMSNRDINTLVLYISDMLLSTQTIPDDSDEYVEALAKRRKISTIIPSPADAYASCPDIPEYLPLF